MLKAACNMQLEGIVSKRLDSAYRSGPSHDWQETKCEVSEAFAMAGHGVDDHGAIDRILLGDAQTGALRYAGSVHRSPGADDLAEVERRLPALKVGRCPLIEKPKGESAVRWTRPEVWSRCRFRTGRTTAGCVISREGICARMAKILIRPTHHHAASR
jgi:bifunctional non-homologous end joining protein LigD